MTNEAELIEHGFQARVDKWMDACFNDAIKADVVERSDRFIEEALEFVQAAGYSAERAHALVDYTFGRPQGEINQEVGGVMVTLAAMCNTLNIDIRACAETELARVWTKIDTIRAKQAAKPTGSALPVPRTPTHSAPDLERVVRGATVSLTSFDGHCVRLDYATREEAEAAIEAMIDIG